MISSIQPNSFSKMSASPAFTGWTIPSRKPANRLPSTRCAAIPRTRPGTPADARVIMPNRRTQFELAEGVSRTADDHQEHE